MTRPRKELVSVQDTPYYHVVSRCVRRSYLCGIDQISGKNYEHRRQWIENRIRILSSLFAIDICAYAVMSNHHHLVVKICPNQAVEWSDREVTSRWTSLFKGPLLIQHWLSGKALNKLQMEAVNNMIEIYRKRLSSLSWFMKCLNEPIARQANQEDGCTGHFWESRFKSQALLTEEALLSCIAYVDLNPIRAGIADTPEDSAHTSIKERIKPRFNREKAIKSQHSQSPLKRFDHPIKPLAIFEGNLRGEMPLGLPCSAEDYLQLIDATGRIIRNDKIGAIDSHIPSIFKRLNIDSASWLNHTTRFELIYPKKFTKKRQLNAA